MLSGPRPWLLATVIWFVVLFFLSHQSKLHPPGPEFENRDKVMHATYFALGGTCLFMALRLRKPMRSVGVTTLIVILFCSGVGLFDEFHQSFIPNRSGNDPWDWLADTFGGVLACGLGSILFPIFKPKPQLA